MTTPTPEEILRAEIVQDMPFDEFTRRHGSDKADGDSWGWRSPESPLGRLKVLGFIAEGTVGGQESVLIPAEVRAALSSPEAFEVAL